MSQPNPELVEALNGADYKDSIVPNLKEQLQAAIFQIQDDLHRTYWGHNSIAALMMTSAFVRGEIMTVSDRNAFDVMVEGVRGRLNSRLAKPNPAVTIVGVLQQNRDTQITL